MFSEFEDGILCREEDDHREAAFHFGYRPGAVLAHVGPISLTESAFLKQHSHALF